MIRLTCDPYQQSTRNLPEDDWQAEGFDYLEEIGAKVNGVSPRALWRAWQVWPRVLWVVRFELVEVVRPGLTARRPRLV